MGFAETDGQGVMGLVLDRGCAPYRAQHAAAQRGAARRAQPLSACSTATPIYVSADRSIDWSQRCST